MTPRPAETISLGAPVAPQSPSPTPDPERRVGLMKGRPEMRRRAQIPESVSLSHEGLVHLIRYLVGSQPLVAPKSKGHCSAQWRPQRYQCRSTFPGRGRRDHSMARSPKPHPGTVGSAGRMPGGSMGMTAPLSPPNPAAGTKAMARTPKGIASCGSCLP